MTKKEFIKEFASKASLTQKDAKEVADIMGSIIVTHMSDEDGVKPFDGIVFKRTYSNPRTGRNPQTGEPIEIAGHFTPHVKFGKAVKEAIQR